MGENIDGLDNESFVEHVLEEDLVNQLEDQIEVTVVFENGRRGKGAEETGALKDEAFLGQIGEDLVKERFAEHVGKLVLHKAVSEQSLEEQDEFLHELRVGFGIEDEGDDEGNSDAQETEVELRMVFDDAAQNFEGLEDLGEKSAL